MSEFFAEPASPGQYTDAIVPVFGDASADSRQLAQSLEWAYRSMAGVISDVGGAWTDAAICEAIPGRVFEFAACSGWIDYFDENGDVRSEKEGEAELAGWSVKPGFRDAFMRLLPIWDYLDVVPVKGDGDDSVAADWLHPTPVELIEGFIGTTKRRPSKLWLARQMAESGRYVHTLDAARQFIKLRCKEPKARQTQVFTNRGLRQAVVLTKVFKKEDPIKYADLEPSHFFWRVASVAPSLP